MKEFQEAATKKGFHTVAIWSISNDKHPMSQEQRDARDHILQKDELPPQYDIVIINGSSETGIDLYGQIDYIIINSKNKDTQTQVRGRYRKDLELEYILSEEGTLTVPKEFLEKPLSKDDKDELCKILNLRDNRGRIKKWTTVKQALLQQGYLLKETRVHNARFTVITDPPCQIWEDW